MTLTELRYIVAVAHAKHFGKAAEECFVSQPTLSVGIRKLEDSLGVTIFERGRSEVKVTPIGQLIINQAEHVLHETQVIKNIAEAEKDQLKNPINIASTYTIGKYLFPHLIKQAYNSAPNISLLFSQDYQSELIKKLENKEVDILILNSQDSEGSQDSDVLVKDILEYDFNSQPVLKEELYLLAAKENKYSSLKDIPVDINNINFKDLYYLNQHHCFDPSYFVIDASPESCNSECKSDSDGCLGKNSNIDSLEDLYQVVKKNNGASIIPALFYQDLSNKQNHEEINVIPFRDGCANRVLSLVWRKDFTRTQVVDILRDSLANISLNGIIKA